ncbi:MAG: Magnesium transporter MgtE [Candidatus Atribacteria bacterium ADurb.Bin276]|jgi:magnesium transporter|uniref:Magnesium transporter MgtE n=1 Tax=Candidatus Atribacter allofermentans TaxID=1852833 RepID=A0A1V5T3M1_9BACT|nr:MAG: Magnesium transporter MgtE [Candidatus Atribacteria bacterium ADurb.Bin276]
MPTGIVNELEELTKKINEFLEQKKLFDIKRLVNDLHPADVAELMTFFDRNDQVVLFRLLKKDMAIAVFEQLDFERQENLLNSFTDDKVSEILNFMSPDDRTELLDELPAKVVKKLLYLLNPDQRNMASFLLGYRENSAGRIMNPGYIDLKENYTITQALERIRKLSPPEDMIYTAYVTDIQRYLIGTITLRDLILSPPEKKVTEIMDTDVVFVSTDDDQELVARNIQKYDLLSLPVVDHEQRLVGVVTVDDAIDIIEEEATEDIHRLAAIQTTEDEYLHSTVSQKVRNRILWLVALLLGGMVTSLIIQNQSALIQTVVSLSFFIPALINTGGNVGSQSTTIMVRGIALNQVDSRNIFKIALKESLVGSILGGLLGLVGFFRVILLRESSTIGVIVGFSIWVVVFVSNLIGIILPLFLKKMKFDPALSATPVITTIVDMIGVFLYFQIARIFIGF